MRNQPELASRHSFLLWFIVVHIFCAFTAYVVKTPFIALLVSLFKIQNVFLMRYQGSILAIFSGSVRSCLFVFRSYCVYSY